jgi:morphogenetic protein associated with SpoVID
VKIHMVKKGDTLYEIAQKHNVDLEKLIASNPQITDPDAIEVGMKVKIPNEPKSVLPPTDYLYKHKIVQGDSLWKLSKAWNVPLQAVIAANPQLKNPNILLTGEIVYIPKTTPQQHSQHPAHTYQSSKPNTAPLPTEPLPGAAETMPPMPLPIEMPTPAPAPTPMPMPMPVPEMVYEQSNMPELGAEPLPLPYMPEQPMVQVPAYPCPEPTTDSYSEMQLFMHGQEPSIHPFQQFQQPAAEVFTIDYTNVPQPTVWTQPVLPDMTAMPYMDQAPYQAYGTEQPSYPMHPQYPVMANDCGCGGPTVQSYDQAIPYPYETSAYPSDSFVMNPYVNYAPQQPMDQMMHPAYMQSFQPAYPYWPSPTGAWPMNDMNGYTPSYDPMAMTSAYPGGAYPMGGYPEPQYPSAHMHGFPYGYEKPDCGCHDREDTAEPTPQKIKFEPVATVSKKEEKAVVKSSDRKSVSLANNAAKSVAKRNRRTKRGSTKAVVNSPWLGR